MDLGPGSLLYITEPTRYDLGTGDVAGGARDQKCLLDTLSWKPTNTSKYQLRYLSSKPMCDMDQSSIIITDGWSAYHNFSSLGYHQFLVNHSIEFVNTVTGTHINTHEGLWRHAKNTVDGNKYVTDTLLEYMWRRRFEGTSGTLQILNNFNAVCVWNEFMEIDMI